MNYAVNLSAQALARVVYVISGAIVFVLLARALGPSRLGEYVFATNLVVVLAGLADLGSTAILARDVVAAGDQRATYLANFVMLRLAMGLAVVVPALVTIAVLAPDGLLVPLVAAGVTIPLIAARFFDPIFQVAGRPWMSLLLSCCYAVAMIGGTATVVFTSATPAYWAVVVYVACGVLYGAVGLILAQWLMTPSYRSASRTGVYRIVDAAWPFCIGSLFAMLTARLDVFMLEALGSTTMVGQYNAAFKFVDLGMAVIVTALTPLVSIFAGLATANRDALRRAFRAMLHFIATYSTAIAVLTPTLSPLVVRVVYGPDYEAAAGTLDVLAWKFWAAFINLLMFATLMTVGSIRFNWWNSALALVVNVSANFLLIPALGILGAGISSLVSELVQMAVVLLFLRAALGSAFDVDWWVRLLGASVCSSALVHAPVDIDRIWLLAPAAFAFLGIMYALKAIPANPMRAVQAEVERTPPTVPAPPRETSGT